MLRLHGPQGDDPGAPPSRDVTRTHCPYCAFQCGMEISGTHERPAVRGDPDFPVNRGQLCVKGWNAGATLGHAERLRSPLARDARGALAPVSWEEAFSRVARGIREVQERFGRDAVGVFGSGALTNEKAYLLGKFARVALGTSHIDYNGRFCMSSAAAASLRAFGLDRGLPFPLEEIARADLILLVGGNVAETLPPIMRYLDAQRAGGGLLIVADPRRTATAEAAEIHGAAMTPSTGSGPGSAASAWCGSSAVIRSCSAAGVRRRSPWLRPESLSR